MRTQSNTIKSEGHPPSPLYRFLSLLSVVVRKLIFLVLMWLRTPILYVIHILGLLFTVGFFVALVCFRERHLMLWSLGGLSFIAFSMRWFYDSLLLKLSTEEIILY